MAEALDPVVEALEDLFETERRALLQGDLDLLPPLAARKADLFDRVVGAGTNDHADRGLNATALGRLRRAAARNAELLAAAAQGVRAAASRIAQLRAGPGPLVTYDGQGRRQTLDGAGATVVRRV